MDDNIYTETVNILNFGSDNDSDFELEIITNHIPDLSYPFLNFYNDNNEKIKVVGIYAPFHNTNDLQIWKDLKLNNIKIIGLSIYQEFPSQIKNPHEDNFHKQHPFDYVEECEGWIHNFKKSIKFGIKDNSYFLNYSDILSKNIEYDKKYKKTIDILIIIDNYFNKSKEWIKYYNQVKLINKFLKINDKYNVTIVDKYKIVDCDSTIQVVDNIDNLLKESKICIVFNKHTTFLPYLGNALLNNCCLLLYHSIIGCWSYINKYTGDFFKNENNLMNKIEYLLNNKFKPRKWYLKKNNHELIKQSFNNYINDINLNTRMV